MDDGWCTIESDPGVFSALLRRMGVRGVQVDEVVLGLDDDALMAMEHPVLVPHQRVLGLILLHKWSESMPRAEAEPTDDVFFARQTVNNACATQALLSVALNAQRSAHLQALLDLGPDLGAFASFCADLDPQSRGHAIGSSDVLRLAHNAFARPEVVLYGEAARLRSLGRRPSADDDAFHFVAFVPGPLADGRVYELDGLQPAPVVRDAESAWPFAGMAAVREKVAQLMAADADIRFGLLAVVRDRVQLADELLAHAEGDEAAQLREVLAEEREKREAEDVENARRQHNLVPLALALLRAKAELAGPPSSAS